MNSKIINAQKAKKTTASSVQLLEVSESGFYSFLIIGRAVTVHCFLADLDSVVVI